MVELNQEFFIYCFNQTAFWALILFSTINLSYLFLLIGSILFFRSKDIAENLHMSQHGISLIVPCYNEEKNIIESLKSFLNLKYENYEIIVVNDGSKDKTLELIINEFNLEKLEQDVENRFTNEKAKGVYHSKKFPKLILLDKINGGKSDALNLGISFSKNDFFCAIDADSLVSEDAFSKIMTVFNEHPETIACGSTIGVINGSEVHNGRVIKYSLPKTTIEIFQLLEYLRCFFIGRSGWEIIKSNIIISGAFGVFRTDPVMKVGGYSLNHLGEDMDLVIKLHKYMDRINQKYSVRYVKEPLCWTEVPFDYPSLKRQRARWHKGLIMSIFSPIDEQLMIRPSEKKLSYLTIPYYIVADIFVPVLVILTYLLVALGFYFGIVSVTHIWMFFLTFVFYSTALTLACILLQELYYPKHMTKRDLFILTIYSFLENFGYRQFINFVKIVAVWEYYTKKNEWGKIERKGFVK